MALFYVLLLVVVLLLRKQQDSYIFEKVIRILFEPNTADEDR
ncbi:MAG: hypothetical protein ABI813_06605 [Bacteroidota bacterium]